MDLRNRENFEEIVNALKAVPSEQLHALAAQIENAAAQDTQLDREAMAVTAALIEKEAGRRAHTVESAQSKLRIHVFSMAGRSRSGVQEYSLRLNGELANSDLTFSDFISRVDIKLPSGEGITWNRTEESADGLTVTRPVSTGDQTAELVMHVAYKNCLYEVPSSLTKTGSAQYLNFVQLFRLVCGYIKANNLSSNDDPSYFTPDAVIHQILYPSHPKNHPVSFASLLEAMRLHFKAPGPFTVKYRIGDPEQVMDLLVQVPGQIDRRVSSLVEEAERKLADKVSQIDKEIGALTADIDSLADDATFLERLTANPIEFIQEIVNTPTGITKGVESAGTIDYLQLATSYEFYKQPWAIAAAAHLVNEQKKATGQEDA